MGLFLENPQNLPPSGASMCVIKNGDVGTLGFLDFTAGEGDLFSGGFDDFREISCFSPPALLGEAIDPQAMPVVPFRAMPIWV